jgi:hypothetical protein
MDITDKDHICYGCEFNYKNKLCKNIIEIDAQCNKCPSKDECLSENPRD